VQTLQHSFCPTNNLFSSTSTHCKDQENNHGKGILRCFLSAATDTSHIEKQLEYIQTKVIFEKIK